MHARSLERSLPSLVTLPFAVALLVVGGCENGVPTFPDLTDAGVECGEDRACPNESDVCLEGRCYRPCTSVCGPLEVCMGGVCRRGTPLDAGPSDGGRPDAYDRCRDLDCPSACRAGVCVQCVESSQCGGGTPICDVARGRCVAYAPSACAACNTDLDCQAGDTVYGSCVSRGAAAGEPEERVCLATCGEGDGRCDDGFRCDGRYCVPAADVSCTQLRALLEARACDADVDCAPIGATPETGLVPGSCQGGTCHLPCADSADCVAPEPTCVEETRFCAP